MVYALVGVPLMLMCLSSLGGLLADALQCTYGKLCGTKNKHLPVNTHEGCQQFEEVNICLFTQCNYLHKMLLTSYISNYIYLFSYIYPKSYNKI